MVLASASLVYKFVPACVSLVGSKPTDVDFTDIGSCQSQWRKTEDLLVTRLARRLICVSMPTPLFAFVSKSALAKIAFIKMLESIRIKVIVREFETRWFS